MVIKLKERKWQNISWYSFLMQFFANLRAYQLTYEYCFSVGIRKGKWCLCYLIIKTICMEIL